MEKDDFSFEAMRLAFKDIMAGFKETEKKFQEVARLSKETDKRLNKIAEQDEIRSKEFDKRSEQRAKEFDKKLKEIDERSERRLKEFDERSEQRAKEFDKKLKEIDERGEQRAKEFDKKLKEIDARSERRAKEYDKKLKEIDERSERRLKELDKRLREIAEQDEIRSKKLDKKINKIQGNFTSMWGKLIEAIVRPASLKLFQDRGIDVYRTQERTLITVDGEDKAEYDIILANGSEIVVVEVKTSLKTEDVAHFLTQLSMIKTYIPDYANKKVYGAMATINYNKQAKEFAIKKGLFVIESSGKGILTIGNNKNFKPQEF